MSFTAVLDAHVLVPARVRDVLLTLAEADLYRPLWSERILDEVCRHLPDSMDGAARDRLLKAMAAAFPEAVVPVPTGLRFDELARINAVTAAEIDAYTAVRFKAHDPNGDGVITRGEAAQLEKADLKPVRFHDVRARTGGAEVSILIEIEGFVEEGDARFFALSEGLGEAFDTATPIGAYPLPEMIGVKEKE